jgi:hypothetical protein
MNRILLLVLIAGLAAAANGQVGVQGPASQDRAAAQTPVDVQSRSANPSGDIRAFGARIDASSPTTCTATAGSPVVKIAAARTFVNGSGIMCVGAGAPIAIATPKGATVTPAVASGPMGTGKIVAGGTGSKAYTYTIVAEDEKGGLTSPSTPTTITNGNAMLGAESVGITSWSRSNGALTITTSGPHGLSVHAMAEITGDNFIGYPFYCSVLTVPDSTHFTCTSNFDTRNGAPGTGGSGGTVTWRNANHLTLPQQSGVFRYWIYGGSAGDRNLVGVSLPLVTLGKNLPKDPLNLTWDDFGLGSIGVPPHPSWVPTNIAADPAKADNLITTVISGGGTTTLTLAVKAGASVTGQAFRECADPGIAAAISSVQKSGFGAGVLIPTTTTTTSFATCGVITVPYRYQGTVVRVSGNLKLGDTLICVTCQIVGDPNAVSSPQFGRKAYVSIASSGAPLLLWSIGQLTMRRLAFDLAGQGVGWLDDGPANSSIPGWDISELSFSSPTHDELARHVVVRGNINGGGDLIADNVTFSASAKNGTNTPTFIMTGANGNFTFKNWFGAKRGWYFGNGFIGNINEAYCQGCATPKFMIDFNTSYGGGSGFVTLSLFNSIEDTTFAPQFAVLNSLSQGVIYSNASNGIAGPPIFTSQGTSVIYYSVGVPLSGVDLNASGTKHLPTPGYCVDGILSISVSSSCPVELQNVSTSYGSAYGWWINAASPPPFHVTVSPGGTIPTGSHTISYAYVYPTSGGGFAVGPYTSAATVKVSSGNQTISFRPTPKPGAVGYSLSDNGFLVECVEPFQAGQGRTIEWRGSPARCGQSQPKYSGGGPVSASKDGLFAPKFQVTSPSGFMTSISASATARRNLTLPDADGVVVVSPITIPFNLFVQAAVCNNATAVATWTLLGSAAPEASCRKGTNVQEATLDFADGDSAQYEYLLPSDWNGGTLDARLLFFSPDTSGTVVFQIAMACASVNGRTSDDIPVNAASSFEEIRLGSIANAQWTARAAEITARGCAAGNSIRFKLTRGTDTATSRVRVKGLEVTIRRVI